MEVQGIVTGELGHIIKIHLHEVNDKFYFWDFRNDLREMPEMIADLSTDQIVKMIITGELDYLITEVNYFSREPQVAQNRQQTEHIQLFKHNLSRNSFIYKNLKNKSSMDGSLAGQLAFWTKSYIH